MSQPLAFEELEQIYDDLAEAIDACGPERESVFLAKLVLRMAQEMGEGARVRALIAECAREPEPPQGLKLI